MEAPSADAALTVCRFLEGYNAIWATHFPNCVKRAHWQIAQLARMREDELLFSEVRSKIGYIFGMDAATVALRTADLIAAGLITSSEKELRSQTFLSASPKLIALFDRHTIEAVQLLHTSAKPLDPRLARLSPLSASQMLNKRFIRFFEDFLLAWNEQRTQFLRKTAEKHQHLRNPVEREKANNALKTHAYWHIFILAWTWRHPLGAAPRTYLVVEDFLESIHKLFQYNSITTRGYVQDLIDWGILERQGRNDGVPRNKFAVRMTADAFDAFSAAFTQAGPIMVGAARDFSRLSNGLEFGEVRTLRIVS